MASLSHQELIRHNLYFLKSQQSTVKIDHYLHQGKDWYRHASLPSVHFIWKNIDDKYWSVIAPLTLALGIIWICFCNNTENRELSWCQLCHNWWHCRLSLWQAAVPPVMTKLASWWLFSLQRIRISEYEMAWDERQFYTKVRTNMENIQISILALTIKCK